MFPKPGKNMARRMFMFICSVLIINKITSARSKPVAEFETLNRLKRTLGIDENVKKELEIKTKAGTSIKLTKSASFNDGGGLTMLPAVMDSIGQNKVRVINALQNNRHGGVHVGNGVSTGGQVGGGVGIGGQSGGQFGVEVGDQSGGQFGVEVGGQSGGQFGVEVGGQSGGQSGGQFEIDVGGGQIEGGVNGGGQIGGGINIGGQVGGQVGSGGQFGGGVNVGGQTGTVVGSGGQFGGGVIIGAQNIGHGVLLGGHHGFGHVGHGFGGHGSSHVGNGVHGSGHAGHGGYLAQKLQALSEKHMLHKKAHQEFHQKVLQALHEKFQAKG